MLNYFMYLIFCNLLVSKVQMITELLLQICLQLYGTSSRVALVFLADTFLCV